MIYRVNQTELARIVNEGIIDMDDPSISQIIKDNIEITVDLQDNEFHKIEINVKRNNTRVEEIKKIRKNVLEKDKNKTKRIDKDVLIVYLDNISRTHFHRKMKNLANYLTEVTEGNDPNYHVFEYFRYHSKAHWTNPNLISMYYGEQGELYNETSNVFKSYSDNGYITGMFSDLWEAESVDFGNEYNFGQPFYKWDHFAGNIAWDFHHDTSTENYSSTDLEIVLSKGRNTPFRRCLYGKPMHEIELEYIKQFWDKYNDTRKLFRTVFMLNHETTGDLIGYANNDFVQLLSYFNDKGYLQQTIVMFVADHGPHFIIGRIPIIPDDSRLQENFFPLLMILVPKDIPKKNLMFLENNQQLFVTSHEIYGLLKSIAVGEKDGSNIIKDYSIMHEDLPKGRDCHLNSGGIKFDQCWCSLDKSFIQEQVNKRGYIYMEF